MNTTSEKKYVIAWKSKLTGKAGHNPKKLDYSEALKLADKLNFQRPLWTHMVRPV